MIPLFETTLAHQVDLTESIRQCRPVPVTELTSSAAQRLEDLNRIQAGLRDAIPPWHRGLQVSVDDIMPTPCWHMYVHPGFISQIEALHSALTKAATNIVERWFSDEGRAFPKRMPLDSLEEDLLKWIAQSGSVPPYSERQGCWRMDFLFSPSDQAIRPIICEINARFPYNAWLSVPAMSKYFETVGLSGSKLSLTHDYSANEDAIFSLFDSTKPLHVLMGESWRGTDIHLVLKLYEQKTSKPARVVYPADLRLVPDPTSKTGHRLSCVRSNSGIRSKSLERIWQISIEITQSEVGSLDPLILQEMAGICVNDFRSIYLVNDQRFLGIVLEELSTLVKQGVISYAEAQIVRDSIAQTLLPSSSGWPAVASSPLSKDSWILKNARDGQGKGHIFGHAVSEENWMTSMRNATEVATDPRKGCYVLQRRAKQMKFDILNLEGDKMEKLHVVGTWNSINGRYQGMSGMRVAEDLCLPIRRGEKGLAMFAVTDLI